MLTYSNKNLKRDRDLDEIIWKSTNRNRVSDICVP